MKYLILFLITSIIYCQSMKVTGRISIGDSINVKYAHITFIDEQLKEFTTLSDSLGNYEIDIITDIEETLSPIPNDFELYQNYPNPFTQSTTIQYKQNKPSEVSIKIYDILGREVKVYNIGLSFPGIHDVIWNGTNKFGEKVATGIYFYKLQPNSETIVRKMIYGLGSNIYPTLSSSDLSKNEIFLGKSKAKFETIMYTVKILNTSSTSPKISKAEFNNIIVANDTTINFSISEEIASYSLVYQKVDTTFYDGVNQPNWEIFLNNISGTNLKNISNWVGDDENPEWSPDGKYIAFESGSELYLYDTANDMLKPFITSIYIESVWPRWTPDSRKLIYGYHIIGQDSETHIVDIDGLKDQKLKSIPEYFYNDSYTFLYTHNYDSIYISDIDNTYDEFVFDLKTIGKNYVHSYDFNPITNDLLILADPTRNIMNLLVSFNINTHVLDTISIADSGWIYLRPKYSNGYQKIAIGEVNYSENKYRFSIIENKVKEVIFELPQGSSFHWSVFAFSKDDKYLALSMVENHYYHLYVVELETGQLYLLGKGVDAKWNPKIPH